MHWERYDGDLYNINEIHKCVDDDSSILGTVVQDCHLIGHWRAYNTLGKQIAVCPKLADAKKAVEALND